MSEPTVNNNKDGSNINVLRASHGVHSIGGDDSAIHVNMKLSLNLVTIQTWREQAERKSALERGCRSREESEEEMKEMNLKFLLCLSLTAAKGSGNLSPLQSEFGVMAGAFPGLLLLTV